MARSQNEARQALACTSQRPLRMAGKKNGGGDARALRSVRDQLQELLRDAVPVTPSGGDGDARPAVAASRARRVTGRDGIVGENGKMALNASRMDGFEELVQQQLAAIAGRLEELGRRLEEERPFAPQKPEEVPGYAELKTALHNLIEHLELAEGRTAEAIGSLREQLEEVSKRTAEALQLARGGGGPVEAVQTLEERINALQQRLEDITAAAESSTRAYVDACMEELAAKVEHATAPAMPENVEEMIRAETGSQVRATEERIAAMVARLQGKIEDLAAGAMDVERLRTDIDRIDDQLNAVRTELQEKVGRDELEQVRASLEHLSAAVEDKADRAEVMALRERLDTLSAQLQAAHAGGAPADDARVAAIEEQVLGLRNMVEEALGEPLAIIGDKLAAHESALAEVSAQGQRLQQMEAIVEQLQQTLEDGAAAHAEDGRDEEIAALKKGLQELEKFAREADRNAREMLEATQATLAEIVERLIELEERPVGQASSPTAKTETPRTEPQTSTMDTDMAAADLLAESAPAPETDMNAPSPARQVSASQQGEPSGAAAGNVDDDPQRIAERISARLMAEAPVGAGNDARSAAPANDGPITDAPAHAVTADMASGAPAATNAAARPVQLEDDFIAAARRAALAASQKDAGGKDKEESGGFLARFMPGRKQKDTAPHAATAPAAAMPASPGAEAQADAKDEDTEGKSKSILGLFTSRKGGKDLPEQAMKEDGRQTEATQSRRRLMLAGAVLLASATLYLTQNPSTRTPPVAKPTVSSMPAEETAQGAPSATTGGAAQTTPSAPATGEPGENAGPANEPAAKNAPRHDEAARPAAPGQDKQASLSAGASARPTAGAASSGLFTPRETASASLTNGSDIVTGSIGMSAASTHQAVPSLPESIGPEALRQAALEGDGKAAFMVATRYLRGHDKLAQNPEKAAHWFRKAADKGVIVAMFRLGAMHEQGLGVPRDFATAAKWYERAALLGNVRAMHNLGALHAAGKLGTPDFEKAAYWFRKAAEHGVRDSQFNLAVLYHRGQGVPQDLEQAWFWYSVAAARGDAMAASQARKLGEFLGADKLAVLRKRLEEFRLKPVVRNANILVIDRPEWRDDSGPQASSLTPEKEPTGKALVMEVQKLLKGLGYDVGPVDGLMGNRTANAIRLFQLQSRLPVNGQPSMELLKHLRAATATHT